MKWIIVFTIVNTSMGGGSAITQVPFYGTETECQMYAKKMKVEHQSLAAVMANASCIPDKRP